MILYDWKNLESLTLSCIPFTTQSTPKPKTKTTSASRSSSVRSVPTSGLPSKRYTYVLPPNPDNSKNVSEKGRAAVKDFSNRRKTALQVYWS